MLRNPIRQLLFWEERSEFDAPIAINIHPCRDIRDDKPSNVPNIANACDGYDEQCQAGVSAAANVYKYTGFEEPYSSMNVEGGQCEVDIPVVNNGYACMNVRDTNRPNVSKAIDVLDFHACIEPKQEGASMVCKHCCLIVVSNLI